MNTAQFREVRSNKLFQPTSQPRFARLGRG
jgi:hypothetical protein